MVARRNRIYPILLLIILIVAISGAYSQQSGRNKNGREACSRVVLKNGKTKLRSGGRVVKFNCNREYVLVGESTSTCLLGEWTSEPPVCATKGCPSIPPPPSGRFIASNGGAVMRLECNPGYRPSHSPMIYCVDRFDWNGTAPICQASGVQQSATRCDFESDDLCGWVQDTRTDEFDWTWQNYGTPSLHLGTGPSFDHTLGQGKAGHYLFIESSSPRILNDTARLFSPVYGAPESATIADEGVCFTFWFHMYGSTTGQLNVYVKPESKKMTELRPAFVRSGDQGDQWKQGYISLDRVTENFQVVIEGVRGNGYVGDSAIDDVQLAKGEECLAALKRMMADTVVPGGSTVQPSSTVSPNASCASRCSTTTTTTTDQQPENSNTTSWICGCSDDCLLKNSCCFDYAAFCLTGRTETSTAKATTDKDGRQSTVTTTASLWQTTTTQPAITSSTTTTAAAATTVSTSTFRPPTSAASTRTTSSVTPSTTIATSTSALTTTTVAPTTDSSTVTMSTSLEPSSTTSQRPTTTTTRSSTTLTSTIPTVTRTTVEPSTTTAIKQTTSNPTTPTTTISAATLRPTIVPTTMTASTWTVTPSSRPTTTSTTTTTMSLLVTDDPPQDGLQGDDDQSGIAADDPSPSTINQTSWPTWFTGAVAAAAVGMAVLLMVGVAGAVMRSRRAVETAGNGRRCRRMRSSQQDQLAEDSDVRYLRDEDDVQLDLTEATPSSKSAASSQRQFADFERL